MTVLVTGGSGFVGSWVLRVLRQRGIQSVAYDALEQPARWKRIIGAAALEIPFMQGSLTDREKLRRVFEEHRVTHVIHLAALLTPACQNDPYVGCEVNVLGTVGLFEEAVRSNVLGLSYASSLAVFGPEPDADTSSNSAAENRPPSFYGAFKKATELIAEQYWMHFKLASVGIRPHVIYGPERDQGLTAAPSLAARAVAKGQSYQINYQGLLGYDYVEDVADAFVRTAMETPPGAAVVDLPSEPATVDQLIQAIEQVAPHSVGQVTYAGSAIPQNDSPRTRLITELLPDWKPTSLREGFRRTIDFYQSAPTPS